MTTTQTRRQVRGTMAVGAAAAVLPDPPSFAAEPPPETSTVRLSKFLAICFAPQYVCEELLGDEGFAEVRFVDISAEEQFNSDTRRVDFLSNSSGGHLCAGSRELRTALRSPGLGPSRCCENPSRVVPRVGRVIAGGHPKSSAGAADSPGCGDRRVGAFRRRLRPRGALETVRRKSRTRRQR